MQVLPSTHTSLLDLPWQILECLKEQPTHFLVKLRRLCLWFHGVPDTLGEAQSFAQTWLDELAVDEEASQTEVLSFLDDICEILGRDKQHLLSRLFQRLFWLSGIEPFEDQVVRIVHQGIQDAGILRVSPQHGETFNPKLHFATARILTGEAEKDFCICEVNQHGYADDTHTIRRAMVSVYRSQAPTNPPDRKEISNE